MIFIVAIVYGCGILLRFVVAELPYNENIFINEESFVVVSPAAFLAFNYIVYGRMLRGSVGDKKGYTLLNPARISTVFVISDVITFLVQVRQLSL